MMKKCELLVPVGGIEQLIAAVENGADAIYLGGRAFNARINAGNFDDREMNEAIDFVHKRGVKAYITMNTLLTEEELEEALRYAAFLYEAGADALIVQDMGLGMLVRRCFPDFSLHLSTQASVYDLRGAQSAYQLGYERVVLARELPFSEIRRICERAEAEIEVFVHGALCFCYSGQCQMSRRFGGRSGNRGQCAQPCRLPYQTLGRKKEEAEPFRHPLSPRDLCLVERIGDLARAGVSSLKIEGRMKSAEYVAVVTAIYRKYLDLYQERGGYTVTEEDRLALEQIFNRGGFTEGYFDGDPGRALMAGDIPKHRGVLIGRVERRAGDGELVDVKLNRKLSIGDGVEIQGEKTAGNIVTYYRERKDGTVRIGDIRGRVKPGAPLYRITSKAQLTEARRTFAGKTYQEGKFLRKTGVDMRFTCSREGKLRLELISPLLEEAVSVETGPFAFDEARNADVSRMEKSLRKTGNTPFRAEKIEIGPTADRNIPVSLINDIRRQGLQQLADRLAFKRKAPEVCLPERKESGFGRPNRLEMYFFTWESFRDWRMPEELRRLEAETAALIPLAEFASHREELPADRNVIPYITNISRGKEDAFIEANFDLLCTYLRDTGLYIGNLSWIQRFSEAGVPVYGDYGLNVCNFAAAAAYETLGAVYCAESLETTGAEQPGSIPLMITQHRLEGDALIDRKRQKISLLKRAFSDQTILLSAEQRIDADFLKRMLQEARGPVRIYLH